MDYLLLQQPNSPNNPDFSLDSDFAYRWKSYAEMIKAHIC